METPLNKTDIIEHVANEMNLSKADASRIYGMFINTIIDALTDGRKVNLSGLGIFETKQRAARVGRNPQTGEPIEIKASIAVNFKAGKSLKDTVNAACTEAEEV